MTLKKNQKDLFKKNGYLIVENFIKKNTVNKLRKLSYDLFRGKYETKIAPDKIKNQNTTGHPKQLCNIWKSDYSFAQLILSKQIAKLALELTGWKGISLNQDSLFCVPPKTGGVTMHQDEAYQDWNVPGKIITVWIPLTDVDDKNSSIKYIIGSHKWKTMHKPLQKFFSGKNYKHSLRHLSQLQKNSMITINAKAGSIVFHHGRMWHGSDLNLSKKDRIAISVHLMPSNSKFSKKIKSSSFLMRYKKFTTNEMDENFFPVIWTRNNLSSKFIKRLKN